MNAYRRLRKENLDQVDHQALDREMSRQMQIQQLRARQLQGLDLSGLGRIPPPSGPTFQPVLPLYPSWTFLRLAGLMAFPVLQLQAHLRHTRSTLSRAKVSESVGVVVTQGVEHMWKVVNGSLQLPPIRGSAEARESSPPFFSWL